MDEKKTEMDEFAENASGVTPGMFSEEAPPASADMFSAAPPPENMFSDDFVPETQAPELQPTAAPQKQKKKPKAWLFILIGVLVVLIAAVCCAPFLFVKLGDSRVAAGEYKNAADLYNLCFGLHGSEKREIAARAILAAQSGETESGITSALENGVSVNITYDLNGGHFTNSSRQDHVELHEADDFKQFYVATKECYEFKGWDVSHIVYEPEFDDSLVELWLKAKFEPEVYEIAYTNLFSDTSENPKTYTYESDTITLKNPSRVGYTFVSWSGSDIHGETETVVIPKGSSGDKAFIANWNPNQYSVEFKPDVECTIENPMTVTYDDAYAFPEIEKRGYTYRGWSDGDTTYTTGLWTLTNGISVTPVWELNIYKLTYDLAEGKLDQANPESYTVLDSEIRIVNPTRHGYTFLGWTHAEQNRPQKEVVIPAGSIGAYDFKANWAGNPHVITLDAAGGTVASNRVNVVFGNQYSIPDSKRTGYTFLGWYDGSNTKYSSGVWQQDNDLNVKAHWEANRYTVSFDTAGGSAVKTPQTATYDQNFSVPNTARKGYEFRGWYYYNTVVSTGPWKIAENTTLKATWRPKTYTLTLNPDGGTVSQKTVQVTFDKTYTLPTPTKRGHTFKGWYNAGTQFPNGAWTMDGDLKLTAKWEVNTYKIHLDPDGGSVSNKTITVTFGKSYSIPDAYGRVGYNFAYWYTGGKKIASSGTYDYDSDLYLFAEWEGKEYTVYLDPEEGEILKTKVTVIYGEPYKLPTPLEMPEGYEFSGWYDGNTKYKTSGTWQTDGDVWLSAKYSPADYKVTFDANGGTVSPKYKMITYHEDYTLPTPTRTGYDFAGWYYKSDRITDGYSWSITANVTLEAAWTPKTYRIYFETNGGYLSYSSMTVEYGSRVSLPTPEKAGYIFSHWVDEKGKKYTGGVWDKTTNMTLSAKYVAIPTENTFGG